ncbi:MAG: pyruvate kinase [bacterium]|nr:pyruvate kinase [bacterium]
MAFDFKLTKIVATIGPASESDEVIEQLLEAGVNVFRFNFKHNTAKWHAQLVQKVRKIADRMDKVVGILLDLQGPELRIEMPADEMDVKKGEKIVLGQMAETGKRKGFWLTHKEVVGYIEKGQLVYAEDGSFKFKMVERLDGENVVLEVIRGGLLKRRKNCNIPGAAFPFPVLVDKDYEGLKIAAKGQVDYLALSFVRSKRDVEFLREKMSEFGAVAQVISKIESKMAIDNIDEIIEVSDGLMVARGDLGVELPIEQVPYYQKMIIRRCVRKGKPVITATQMLQSMIESLVPTRAEVSDVANAVFDRTDAVMLSGESATGKHPVEVVKVMSKTAKFNEKQDEQDTRHMYDFEILDREQLVCDGAYDFYITSFLNDQLMKFVGIVAFSETGRTVLNLAKYRPNVPIFTFVPNQRVRDRLSVVRGVVPFCIGQLGKKESEVEKKDIAKVREFLLSKKLVVKGDNLILVHGDVWKQCGGTSTVRVMQI